KSRIRNGGGSNPRCLSACTFSRRLSLGSVRDVEKRCPPKMMIGALLSFSAFANRVRRLAVDDAGKDLQPYRLEQSHAHDVLVFVTDSDVVKKNSFQLETKPTVEIDIAHVDVARVDVNLVQIPDHESIIKEAERRAFPDAFAVQPGFPHQLF